MSSQREKFRDVVLARAEELGLTSDARIVAAGGPSTSTMTKIRALGTDPRGDVLQRLDSAMRWPAGSALRLWRDGVAPSVAATSSLEDFTDVELADELARRLRQREDVGIDDSSTATRQAPGSGADIHQLHEPGMPSPGAETTKAARAGTVTPNPLEGVGEEHQGEGPEGGA